MPEQPFQAPPSDGPAIIQDFIPPQTAAGLDRNARQLRKEQLRLFPPVPVTDVTVVIGIKDPAGTRREIHHQVETEGGLYRIIECAHGIKEEMAVVKEDGAIIGYEPTGKYRLKVDVTFVKD